MELPFANTHHQKQRRISCLVFRKLLRRLGNINTIKTLQQRIKISSSLMFWSKYWAKGRGGVGKREERRENFF